MKRMIKYVCVGFAVIGIVSMSSGVAHAQDKPISISIDKKSVVLGDSCTFTIRVNDASIQPPTIEDTSEMTIDYLGAQQESFSSFQLVINGRKMETNKSGGGVKYNYRVVPLKTGILTFPAVDISVEGETKRVQPFAIEVVDMVEQSDDIFVVQEVDKTNVYLGEKVKYRLTWYFNKDIEGYECNIPWLASMKNFAIRDVEPNEQKRYQHFLVNGNQEVLAERSKQTIKGKQYAVISFEKELVPMALGDYSLGEAFIRCDVVTAYQQRRRSSMFDDFFSSDFDSFFGFGRKAITEPFIARSDAVTISVKDVPSLNRPESYSNAIGLFDFKVSL